MEILCVKCKDEMINYFTTLKREDDITIYKNIVIYNIDLCDVDKILNDYIEIHNKKFNFYFVKCLFDISFDDDIFELETVLTHNKEIYKLNIQLLFFIDILKSEGKDFNKINQMTINIHSYKCIMTPEYSRYMRFNCIERRISIISAKYPNILKNNILI